ncbi:MAG: DUF1971 domain-containing protein [Pseudomonadota bacterium]
MIEQLPDGLTRYKTTPAFTEETVPKGLLKDHQTAAGVWGKLVVSHGEIEFVVTEAGQERTLVASPQRSIHILPAAKHHVRVTGPVTFAVEFFR